MKDSFKARQQYEEEDEEAEIMAQLNEHVQNYPINIPFPANVSSGLPSETKTLKGEPPKKLRTDLEFIQHRLIENGLMFGEFQSIGQVTEVLGGFVAELEQSGCYETVRAAIGKGTEVPVKQAQIGETKMMKQSDDKVSSLHDCSVSFVSEKSLAPRI